MGSCTTVAVAFLVGFLTGDPSLTYIWNTGKDLYKGSSWFNTLKKVLLCVADIIFIAQITYKMINNALLIDN